jgi:hypothetical protein
MKVIARSVGRRGLVVLAFFGLAIAAIVAVAQALAGGTGASSASGGTAALMGQAKVAPVVFRGDVRDFPQIASRVRPKRELEEPAGWKQGSGSLHRAPNVTRGRAPSPTQNFAGLSRTDTCTGGQCGDGIPPDTNGAVGPNHYIQSVNSAYGIYNKSGTLLASFTENALWSGAGTFCDGNGGGDPVVLYDSVADRWILTHLAYGSDPSTGPFYQCIAASRSGDPVSGGWYLYALRMDQGSVPVNTLNDYPKFGIWTDCLDFSFNGFQMPAGSYNGTGFGSISRSDMYSGATLTWALGFLAGQSSDAFTMIPGNLDAPGSGGLPPPGTPNYLVSESLFIYNWNVRKMITTANCGGGALTPATGVSQTHYAAVGGSVIPQPPPATASNNLDSLGDRIMQKVQYRRVGGAESLWIVHSATAAGGRVAPHWAQLNVTGGAIATAPVQQQIYAPDASLYRWMPSIAADSHGDVALVYSTSSAASPNFPSIKYSGRLASDPPNQLPQAENQLIAGNGSEVNTCGGAPCHRWGDYSSMSVDPTDGCTFWFTTEYYTDQNGGNTGAWNTRIGSFTFPSCLGQAPPKPPCKVPRVVGKPLATAKKKIKRAHCRVGKITRKASTPKKKGRVLKQSPRAGKKLGNGHKVNLTVGKGRRRH